MNSKTAPADINGSIDSLHIYRGVRSDCVINGVYKFTALREKGDLTNARKALYRLVSDLTERAEQLGLRGNVFSKYVISVFLYDENAFSLACEKTAADRQSSVYGFVLRDMERLLDILSFDLNGMCRELGRSEDFLNYVPNRAGDNGFIEQIESAQTPEGLLEAFQQHYAAHGCGLMSQYRAFRFDGEKLAGIQNCDATVFSDIIGYTEQKKALIANTEAFLNGAPANNALLIGARGTGKSSCVKALLNMYYDKGLRIVEIAKSQLEGLPKITKLLTNRGKYFILFIDDLSFDEFEVQYKYMKSLLEGGIEKTPPNVLFYATSNRRHIIKEAWADKDGTVIDDGEVHASDAVNEKLSLSDRFGLTVSFTKPSPVEYFAIVKELAEKAGLNVADDVLRVKSGAWELTHHGLSGRSARQFVNHLICEENKVK